MRRRALALAAIFAIGCAHGHEPDVATLASSSDQIIWETGQKAFEKQQWETARQYFKRIVDGFPQSQYGPGARLALADSHFKEGGTPNYILAVSEYREFLTLYPSHPRSDYAQLQSGECFFKQKNSADRDQTPTEKALEEYQRLLELYPGSTYLEQARARIAECRQTLARHELQVGYFYQRTRQAYRAAIARYEGVLSAYPEYPRIDEVLFRLAECLALAGRPAEALPHLGKLLESYPRSEFKEAARKLFDQLAPATPAAVPSPSPPPAAAPTPHPP